MLNLINHIKQLGFLRTQRHRTAFKLGMAYLPSNFFEEVLDLQKDAKIDQSF